MKSATVLWAAASTTCFYLASPTLVSAQTDRAYDNYQNYLVGGRAAGMGGAYTAISDDESGMFYNPAGIAFADRSSLSLSVSLYGIVTGEVEDALGTGGNYSYSALNVIPSTVGSLKKLGANHTLGFAVFAPNSLLYKDRRTTEQGDVLITSLDDQTLWAGPAFGTRITPRIAVGAGAFVLMRTFGQETTFLFVLEPPDATGITASFAEARSIVDTTVIAVTGLLGARVEVTPILRVGASFRLPSQQMYSTGSFFSTLSFAMPQDPTMPEQTNTQLATTNANDLAANFVLPWKLAVGMAYGRRGGALLSVDYSLHGPVDYWDIDDRTLGLPVRGELTHNANLGTEFWLGRYALRAGLFTNLSSTPRDVLSTGSAHVDQLGIAAGVGVVDANSETTLGINATFGSGDGVGINGDPVAILSGNDVPLGVTNARRAQVYLFLGTSYRF